MDWTPQKRNTQEFQEEGLGTAETVNHFKQNLLTVLHASQACQWLHFGSLLKQRQKWRESKQEVPGMQNITMPL